MWLHYFVIGVFILFIVYVSLIFVYRIWFLKLKPFTAEENITKFQFFSVIIPARNEEENIEKCLLTVLQQDYSTNFFEVIVVNDHSTDQTEQIVQRLCKSFSNLRLLNLEEYTGTEVLNAYKKKAISIAIQESKGDWIVTTDADCLVTSSWLHFFNTYIHKNNPKFIAAPVIYINSGSVSSIFQCLDFISLQGITAASVSAGFHSMCNGANLAYEKQAFKEVNGFEKIDQKASGDDMLLMQKIKKHFPGKVRTLFAQQSIVKTHPMPDWKSFLNQRIRWASKATHFKDYKIISVLILLYLFNVSLIILPLIGLFYFPVFIFWIIIFFLKTISEWYFMSLAARFFNQESLLKWFWKMQPIHIIYTVTAGFLGLFGNFEWKGRQVK